MAVLVADNRLAELASLDLNSLEGIIDELRVADFDTLLTGFDETDLDTLLQGDDAAPGDDDDDGELDKGDVTIVLGLYRFQLTQDDYLAWIDSVKQDVGFEKQAVTKELRRRLGV
jgi:hypothetical protein